MVTVWMNNNPQDHLMLPHRGLAYGDGLFETIRIQNREAPLFERHIKRLLASAHTLGIGDTSLSKSLPQQILNRIKELPAASGVLKVLVLRPQQGRGYGYVSSDVVDIIIEFYPADTTPYGWDLPPLRLGCCLTPVSVNTALAGHKHLNRLDSVLAMAECQTHQWDDGLRLAAGNVIEATSANVFLVRNNCLFTPELSSAGVKGIARGLIMERAVACFDRVEETTLTLEDVFTADALFLTNALVLLRRVYQVHSDLASVNFSPALTGGVDRLETLLKEEFVL